MFLVHVPISEANPALPVVALTATRRLLAKRRWRGVAADGVEFGFELETPLKPGDVFFQSETARYVVEQETENVIAVSLAMAASAAAGIGWAIGNLHLELQSEPARLLAPDEPAVRQLLARLNVPFTTTTAVFRPGRFARGNLPTHELGPSHQH